MSIMYRLDQSYLKSEGSLEVNLTKCPVMKGFNRTKPIIDQTLLVDQPLFQALTIFSQEGWNKSVYRISVKTLCHLS